MKLSNFFTLKAVEEASGNGQVTLNKSKIAALGMIILLKAYKVCVTSYVFTIYLKISSMLFLGYETL